MRFTIPLLSLLSAASPAFTTLHSRQSLPQCATTCLTNANTGGCGASDIACLCANQSFTSSVTSCIYSTCSGSDIQTSINYAQQLCASVGVTLSISTATATGTAASTVASASATSTTATSSNSGGAHVSASISVLATVVAAFAFAATI